MISDSYTYDLSGNPQKIYFTNGSITKYVYSATGQKLRMVHYTAKANITRTIGQQVELKASEIQSTDSTDYLLGGSLVVRNGKIDKYLFDGGYAQATASGTTDKFTFYYQNKDHLGTVRETVTSTGAMKQRVNYYPFGGQLVDTLRVMMWNRDFQQYKYNGKEFDNMYGLNTYDYGARQHDPILARWDRLDPLCEKYYGVSPYAYANNNPVKLIDPDGKQPVKYIDSNGSKHISWSVVVLVRAPKDGASQRSINRHERDKQSLTEQYVEQFNHFLNGDGNGVKNTSGETVFSEFKITVLDVSNCRDKREALKLSKEYGQDIKKEDANNGKNGNAAVFMEGGTGAGMGLTTGASLITIAPGAPEGTESHELFHTSGIPDNGYTQGGILNSPPEPISPEEVDKLWDILPERK